MEKKTGFYTAEKVNENLTCIRSMSGELMYLLEGESQCALVDTCAGVGHLREFAETLTDKPVTVFLTHGHIDHAMGAPDFEKVYMNQKDIPLYQSQCSVEERMKYVQGCAGPEVSAMFSAYDYTKPEPEKVFEDLKDGMTFEIAPFHIRTYALPGHTPGSMIFLIQEMGILILGDACNNSTFLFGPESLPLELYQKALRAVRNRLKGTYRCVFLSHHVMEAKTDIMDNVIEVCEEALAGRCDDLPFEFMGMQACIAKKCNGRFEREDGKDGNIIYKKGKLHELPGD